MGKLAKILFIVLGVFVAAVVALAVFLPMYFDPNDYKDEISAAVKEETGRDLVIAGDIGLSVFPWLGAEVGEARLSNAPGFGDKPMAEIREVGIRLKLMPLLKGNIQVGRVSLAGLRLRLGKNAQGTTNWQDILDKQAEKEKAEPDQKVEHDKSDEDGFKVQSLQVEGVDVTDAAIYWSDASTGADYKLEEVNLETGVIEPGKPFPLELAFVMNQNEPNVTTQVDLSSTASVDVEKKVYGLDDLVLELTAIGESIPNGKQTISLTADADVNLANETAELPNLVVQAAGGRLDGSLKASQILGDPVLQGSLKGDSLPPRDIMKTLGMQVPETADPNVLSNASVNLQFNGKLSNLSIKPLTVVLDDTNINGSASLRRNSPLVVGFDLNVDSINLDRYLPPREKPKAKSGKVEVAEAPPAEGQVKQKSTASDINDTEIPVDVLKSLNLNGALKVKALTVKGMAMNNVALKVESRDGVMDIKPLDASLYKGNADISGRVNAKAVPPSYALQTNIRSVQSGPLLKDLMGHDRLSGLANIALDLTSTGKTVGAVRQDLDGTINVEFLEGQIKGFNLVQMIRAAKARFKGEPPPPAEPQVTDFAVLSLSGVINNGVMTSNDLNFKSPFLRVGGEGKVNLVSEAIDYLAKVSIVGSATGQGGKDLQELKGLTIPIRLKGNLRSPGWKIELDEAFKEKAMQRVEEEKAAAQKKLEAKQEEAKQEYEEKKEEKKEELKRKLFEKLTED